MDKVTCIAYLLYNSSKNQDIKERAIQLLNGDVSIRDLKRIRSIQATIIMAESSLRKNTIDKHQVQLFMEKFMAVEV